MNLARSLYSILNVIIFLLLIGLSLGILFFVMMLFGVKQDVIGLKYDALIFKTERVLYVFTFLEVLIYAVFVAALWKLRKATKLLLKNDFYNSELIGGMFNSGKLTVLSSVALWCIDVIGNLFYKRQILVGLSEKTLVYLLLIAIGLFLMLMSTVLTDTNAIKQENDLTI